MAKACPSPPRGCPRYPHLVVVDQGVHPLVPGLFAHEPDVADDLDPGGVRRDQEHRHPPVDVGVGVGDGHDDEEGGRAGIGGEVLPPVDDPLVAVAGGPGLEERRIRPALGLGHRIAREDLTVEQRPEVLLLLLVGPVVGDDLGIAGVGRLGPEHDRRPLGPSEDLVHEGELHLPVALATELGAEVAGPQAAFADLLFERVDDGPQCVVERVEGLVPPKKVDRLNLVADEGVDPVQLLLELGLGGELPPHLLTPLRRPAVNLTCVSA